MLISLQVHVLGMKLSDLLQREKARIRWVRKDPNAFRMLMTPAGKSTRANILSNISLQSSQKIPEALLRVILTDTPTFPYGD